MPAQRERTRQAVQTILRHTQSNISLTVTNQTEISGLYVFGRCYSVVIIIKHTKNQHKLTHACINIISKEKQAVEVVVVLLIVSVTHYEAKKGPCLLSWTFHFQLDLDISKYL